MLDRVPNWGVALLAGVIFPLGLAPFDVWPVIPLSAGLLYTALNRTQRPVGIGFAYGAGFFGAGVSVPCSVHRCFAAAAHTRRGVRRGYGYSGWGPYRQCQ